MNYKHHVANPEIYAAKGDIPLWKISSCLKIHEVTLNRWLRQPLSAERKEQIMEALTLIKNTQKVM